MRDDAALAALVARAAELGGPHVVVNNAGGWSPGPQFPEASPEVWSATLDLDLRAPMLLTQLALPAMVAAGGGVVVGIGSSAGVGVAGYGSPEYAAAKAGLVRFTASVAGLEETHGVRVTAVVPDWIGLDRAVAEVASMAEERATRAGASRGRGGRGARPGPDGSGEVRWWSSGEAGHRCVQDGSRLVPPNH